MSKSWVLSKSSTTRAKPSLQILFKPSKAKEQPVRCRSAMEQPRPASTSPPPQSFVLLQTISYWVSRSVLYWLRSKARGIRYKLVVGDALIDNGIGRAIYQDFLPEALKGTFVAAPSPHVVGKGLEYIQVGLDLLRKGVSAKKVVVSL